MVPQPWNIKCAEAGALGLLFVCFLIIIFIFLRHFSSKSLLPVQMPCASGQPCSSPAARPHISNKGPRALLLPKLPSDVQAMPGSHQFLRVGKLPRSSQSGTEALGLQGERTDPTRAVAPPVLLLTSALRKVRRYRAMERVQVGQDADRKGSFLLKSMPVFEYPTPDFRVRLRAV